MEEKFTIIGRRWFERTNGNTYHSVEVYDGNGKLIGNNQYQYGYGDQYLQTAHDILQREGYYPKTGVVFKSGMPKDLIDFMDDVRTDKFLVSCTDVGRKKDL